MSVLVDTSVRIRFLSNRAPYALELDRLLSHDDVSGHDFVYGELLIGDKGGRTELLANYERSTRCQLSRTVMSSHSYATAGFIAVPSDGSTCISWLRPSWAG